MSRPPPNQRYREALEGLARRIDGGVVPPVRGLILFSETNLNNVTRVSWKKFYYSTLNGNGAMIPLIVFEGPEPTELMAGFLDDMTRSLSGDDAQVQGQIPPPPVIVQGPDPTELMLGFLADVPRNLFEDDAQVQGQIPPPPDDIQEVQIVNRQFTLISSARGLVVVKQRNQTDDVPLGFSVFVFNPINREVLSIAVPESLSPFPGFTLIGFGVASNGRFKIVALVRSNEGTPVTYIHVYTLGQPGWTLSDGPNVLPAIVDKKPIVFDGDLYVVTKTRASGVGLFALNLASQQQRRVPFVTLNGPLADAIPDLGIINNHLAAIAASEMGTDYLFTVWDMNPSWQVYAQIRVGTHTMDRSLISEVTLVDASNQSLVILVGGQQLLLYKRAINNLSVLQHPTERAQIAPYIPSMISMWDLFPDERDRITRMTMPNPIADE